MSKTYGTVLLKTTDPKALEELSKKRTEKVYDLQNGWLTLTDEELYEDAAEALAQKLSKKYKTLALTACTLMGENFSMKLYQNGKEAAAHAAGGMDVGYNPVAEMGEEALKSLGFSAEDIERMNRPEPAGTPGDPALFAKLLDLPPDRIPLLSDAFTADAEDAGSRIEDALDLPLTEEQIETCRNELGLSDLAQGNNARRQKMLAEVSAEMHRKYPPLDHYPLIYIFQDSAGTLRNEYKKLATAISKEWNSKILFFCVDPILKPKKQPYSPCPDEMNKIQLEMTLRLTRTTSAKTAYIDFGHYQICLVARENSWGCYAMDFSETLRAPIVCLRKENGAFFLSVDENGDPVSEAKRDGEEILLPDVPLIQKVLGWSPTEEEFSELFHAREEEAFEAILERLFGVHFNMTDEELKQKFHCVSDDGLWFSIYEKKDSSQ